MLKPCEPEPWRISRTGKVTRVSKARPNLNARQERFVLEYLKQGNGTKAAIAAGYAFSSAAVHAYRLLKNETVLKEIRARQNRIQQANDDLVKKTLREFEAVAFLDPRQFFDDKWNLLPLSEMCSDARSALDSLEVEVSVKGGVRAMYVKFADKMAALNALANILGMFPRPLRAGK